MIELVFDGVDEVAHALHGRVFVVFPDCGNRIVNYLCAASVEAEGADRGKSSAVGGYVLAFFFGPEFVTRVVAVVGRDAVGAEVAGVAVAREHEFAFGTDYVSA